MQSHSHFNFFIRSLLQLCYYLIQQLPTHYKVLIDADMFLSAFSMVNDEDERVKGSSWKGAPDGSAYDSHIEELADDDPNTLQDRNENSTMEMQMVSSSSSHQELDRVQSKMSSKFRNLIVVRRQLALEWLDHQKRRYKFLPIAVNQAPDWEYLRNRLQVGPHGARRMKSAKGKGKGKDKDKGKGNIVYCCSTYLKSTFRFY
jgi:hypothetical protein